MSQDDIEGIIGALRHDEPEAGVSKETDLAHLKRAWVAERMAPELLAFEGPLLERVMDRVREQVNYIEEHTVDLRPETDVKMKLLIVESELERVKFVIRSYLRTRLTKIDKYTMFIRGSKGVSARLSTQETQYLERHYELLTNLYKGQFLSSLPQSLQRLDDSTGGISMIEEPDIDRAVFVRVNKTVPQPIVSGADQLDLEKGNIYLLRYSSVTAYLDDGSAELV